MYFLDFGNIVSSTLRFKFFCHILQQLQADILSTQRKNRNAYTFRFPVERETGFEPATPTLARLYSTPEPLAHLLIYILLSARCTLQMILYRNSPHLSTPIFNFFQKKSKVSTISSIFALHQTPAQLSSPHKFTPNHPPGESRLLSIRPPNLTYSRRSASWRIQTSIHPTCSRRSASWRIQPLYPRPHRQTSRGFVPAVQRA